MNINQSKLRLRQRQGLTNEQLDEYVRYEIEYLFLKETINDQLMPELLERKTVEQLRRNALLFFESLAELLKAVGIGIDATPYIRWYDARDELNSHWNQIIQYLY
jgi:hypothetical protein